VSVLETFVKWSPPSSQPRNRTVAVTTPLSAFTFTSVPAASSAYTNPCPSAASASTPAKRAEVDEAAPPPRSRGVDGLPHDGIGSAATAAPLWAGPAAAAADASATAYAALRSAKEMCCPRRRMVVRASLPSVGESSSSSSSLWSSSSDEQTAFFEDIATRTAPCTASRRNVHGCGTRR